jgi:polysaccharide biosynthesis protein PslG
VPPTKEIRAPRKTSRRDCIGCQCTVYYSLGAPVLTYLQKLIAVVILCCLLGLPLLPAPPRGAGGVAGAARDSVLGVHGRLTDEVEQWKIEQSTDMMAQMGASWLVEYFPWAYIEPARGRFDWAHSDMVVRAAESRGFKLIARLDMVPDWARPADSTSRYLDREHYSDYARFAAQFASRYRGQVEDIVIWNEPNLNFEWGYRAADPRAYTELLKTAYQAIKSANPDVSVVAAGLAPTLDAGEWGLDDLDYLQQMYDAGAKPYFDKLAIHAYGWRLPPDDPPAADKVNFARAELQRQVMVANGDEAKEALITESGWNDHPRWSKAVRPAQRIEYSLRAVDKVATEWPWVEAIAFWSFRLPRDAHNYNDYFTFVTVDFTPKPIYDAFRQRAADPTKLAGYSVGRIGE